MTRIVHISDLHFGKDEARLIEPLLEAIERAAPDLVAVSGDLTQRAFASQYREARAFLERLPAPWVSVPGNHDVPLYNPFMRFVLPYHQYRRHIATNLAPSWRNQDVILRGLNTVDPYAWQRGRIRRRQLDRICSDFEAGPQTRIIMAHHPFDQSPESHKQLMKGAGRALERLAACRTDIILSGHLHLWRAEPFVARKGGGRILQIHVGTGLSTRQRGQPNDFAILDLTQGSCKLHHMVANDVAFKNEGCDLFALNG